MSEIPEPLLPPNVDLRDFPYMPLMITRLFNSEFHARANDSEWRAGVTLWLKAFHLPGASLPDDDVQLARLAEFGRDLKSWQKVRGMALHGWIRCSDGRLHHPVVAEVAQGSWLKKIEHAEKRERDRQRLNEWREQRRKKGAKGETSQETHDETCDETELKRVSQHARNGEETTDETRSNIREGKGRDSKLALSSNTQNLDRSDSGSEIQKNEVSRIKFRPGHGPNYGDPTNREAFANQKVVEVLAEKTNTPDAWNTVMEARDPNSPNHLKAKRECEQIARAIAVVWEPDRSRGIGMTGVSA